MLPNGSLPDGFAYISNIIPDIKENLIFFSNSNFTGRRVEGYLSNRAILTQQAIEALKEVQSSLTEFDLGLVIYDAYRPTKSTEFLVRYLENPNNGELNTDFFPNVRRDEIVKKGYVAKKSEHNRGSTVDLSLISKENGIELDMGGRCGLFDEISNLRNKMIKPQQKANRMLLYQTMKTNGFSSMEQEWWHYRLTDEPFPDTYFNFDIL